MDPSRELVCKAVHEVANQYFIVTGLLRVDFNGHPNYRKTCFLHLLISLPQPAHLKVSFSGNPWKALNHAEPQTPSVSGIRVEEYGQSLGSVTLQRGKSKEPNTSEIRKTP